MNEISLVLFKQVKKELNIQPEKKIIEVNKPENKKMDGLSYIFEYIPKIGVNKHKDEPNEQLQDFEEEYRIIGN
jgi:hypothetical protein